MQYRGWRLEQFDADGRWSIYDPHRTLVAHRSTKQEAKDYVDDRLTEPRPVKRRSQRIVRDPKPTRKGQQTIRQMKTGDG